MSRRRRSRAGVTVRIDASGVWHNWAGNQRCQPLAVHRPLFQEELAELVGKAAAAGRRVKVAAAGHSFSAIGCTDGCLIDVGRYGRLLAIDREARTATVQAGIKLSELTSALAERNLALPDLGEASQISFGGAISTGTHGSSGRLGNMATQVISMEIVTAEGSVVSASAGHDPDLFAGRVGLGALGVLSTLVLQCVPAFNLRVVERLTTLVDALAGLEAAVESNDHFQLSWFPYTDLVMTRRANRTTDEVDGRSPGEKLREQVAREITARFSSRPAARARRAVAEMGRSEYTERGYEVLSGSRWPRRLRTEYSLPRAGCADALLQVKDAVESGGIRVAGPVQVRFVAADDIDLSPASGRDTCCIELTPLRRAGEVLDELDDLDGLGGLGGLGGRPHWGMLHGQASSSLAAKYPRWDHFQAVRRRLDPTGVFANDELDRILGPP